MSRYQLTDAIKNEYLPKVKFAIQEIELGHNQEKGFNFSDTKLNPYTLNTILEELGYEQINNDRNGWEMDFWYYYHKDGCTDLCIAGSGIIFEMFLRARE